MDFTLPNNGWVGLYTYKESIEEARSGGHLDPFNIEVFWGPQKRHRSLRDVGVDEGEGWGMNIWGGNRWQHLNMWFPSPCSGGVSSPTSVRGHLKQRKTKLS